MFNPNRLSLARKRRRFTAKELARQAGVSHVTLSRLKKGSHEPEPETVEAFSRVLGFPKVFFFGDDIDELNQEAASFRSLSAMTARERDAALASGALAYTLADWVDERFNLPKPSLMDMSHEADPAAAARSLRQFWGLGERPISSMIKLLESKGVRVFSLAENTRNVDAFSCWRNSVPYVFLNTFKSAEHSRFDAAHELAHLVLHRHGGPQGREAEREADSFAGSFLMPKSDVLARLPRVSHINQLIAEKRRWGVSLSALAYRLHKLHLLSDWQYRTYCIQINTRGFRVTEPNPMAREESVVWKKVFTELWNDRITKERIAEDLAIPSDELENLVFGLTSIPERPAPDSRKLRPVV